MLALAQYFPLFTEEEAQALAEASVSNRQIWDASLCQINPNASKTQPLARALAMRVNV